jgi:hypothetical protein
VGRLSVRVDVQREVAQERETPDAGRAVAASWSMAVIRVAEQVASFCER